MIAERNAVASESLCRRRVYAVALLFVRDSCGTYVKFTGQSGFCSQMPEYEFRHRGAADVAVTYEYDFLHDVLYGVKIISVLRLFWG